MTVTVTPGSDAPVWSLTVPCKVAVETWARLARGNMNVIASVSENLRIIVRVFPGDREWDNTPRETTRRLLEAKTYPQLQPTLAAAGDDPAKIRVGQAAYRLTELWSVEHVLSLDSELDGGRANFLKPTQEKIEPLDLWPTHVRIGAGASAERERSRLREGAGVEPAIERLLARRDVRVIEDVGVGSESGGHAVAGRHAAEHERPPAREGADAAHSPTTDHMRDPSRVGPPLAGTDRELPDEVRAHDVCPVVLRDRLRFAQIVRIDDGTAAAAESLGNGVFFFAHRVRDLIRQPLRGPLFEPRGDAFVPRVAHRIAEAGDARVVRIRFQELRRTRVGGREQCVPGPDDAEERVRNQRVQRRSLGQRIGRNGVARDIDPQVLVPRTDVGHLGDHLPRELALEADVPHVRERCLKIAKRRRHRTADDRRGRFKVSRIERASKRGARGRRVGRGRRRA